MISRDFQLQTYNTFGVPAKAAWFTSIESEEALKELFADQRWASMNRLILGGGSNMLFTQDFAGLVIRMNIKGIRQCIEADNVYVSAGGGEVWNDLVNYCVDHHFAGIENMSLIPGSAGASPVQNIGAYGAELMDIFHSCRAFHIRSGEVHTFLKEDCGFSYRDSVFKNSLKGEYIITEVTLKLSLIFNPNIEYGAISSELQKRNIQKPTIKDVSEVVSYIRVSKLPDPATIGNAGSFFKNPIIPVDKFIQLQSNFPDIVNYPMAHDSVKLAAGWMIEQCGWKGRIVGNTGTWKNQALVLVNHGKATGSEIYQLSEAIIQSVDQRFGVLLEREVNII